MKVWEIFGVASPVYDCTPSPLLCSDSMVGIEHELEGARDSNFREEFTDWDAIRDGSLRNGGIEYVLKRPLSGQELITAIRTIDTYVGAREHIVSNERTSTHVHVDVRDMTAQQLLMFFVVYTTYEQVLFSLCDDSRTENNFCVPVRKNGGVIKRMRSLAKEPTSGHHIQQLGNSTYRYAAMNMASLPRFGSLEFRMRETLTDTSQLIDWINVLLSIKEFAVEHGDDSVTDAVTRMGTMNPLELTTFIFGDDLGGKINMSCPVEMYVSDGAELARHIFHDEEATLLELSSVFEKVPFDDDKLCSIAHKGSSSKAAYLRNILSDKDPYYTYPAVNWDAMVFTLKEGAKDWWEQNMSDAPVQIHNKKVKIRKLCLLRDCLNLSRGVCIEDLLVPTSLVKYREWCGHATEAAAPIQSSVELPENNVHWASLPPQYFNLGA